ALRPTLPVPAALELPPGLDPGRVPALGELSAASPAASRPPGGEAAGRDRLSSFAADGLPGYAEGRDGLGADGGPRLSPYLRLGCLPARTVAAELAGRPCSEPYLRQLAWRDFFHQVLAARPDAAWRDYRDRGDRWCEDEPALQAWQSGRTGYPVVD